MTRAASCRALVLAPFLVLVLVVIAAGACGPRPAPWPVRLRTSAPVLTGSSFTPPASLEEGFRGPVDDASVVVDCRARPKPISPGIYGIAYNARKDREDRWLWELFPTGRRWGGNATSRYNWVLGNAWNTGSDWYFRNVDFAGDPRFSWTDFLDDNAARGAQSALTIPMLGWVAKDTTSYAFPVSRHGPQQDVDPWLDDAGNGVSAAGRPLRPGPPERTSVRADPSFIERWVRVIRARDEERGRRSVDLYLLGNEPMLWDSTHRDVHPEPTTYDELLEKTLAYGRAVRRADPEAKIAGPGLWGWPAYFYSAKDAAAGFHRKPDRRAHGDVPLLEWWLRKLRAHEKRTGERIIDFVDVHFYPEGLYNDRTDRETALRRLRSTRSLWDRAYVEETYIKEPVYLLPRMHELIARNHPGLGLVIGEYNFGGERHMSGALALAEALGRFGLHDVHAAYLWTYPPRNSPAFWAFLAYRNYDGRGARFLDLSLPAKAPAGMSAFASRDERGTRVVTIVLNLDPDRAKSTRLSLRGCAETKKARAFTLSGETGALVPRAVTTEMKAETRAETTAETKQGGTLSLWLPPWSVTVVEARLD